MPHLFDLNWTDVRDLDPARTVAILPVGAIEAHGPHLPLATDVIIAEAMAREGARRLTESGLTAIVLPPLAYTPTPFARAFPGTIHIDGDAFAETVRGIGASLAAHGIARLAVANAHLDPDNVGAIRTAVARMPADLTCTFPDVTRKPWALRLTDEFKSGACHAGRYEASIVMAERPDLVRESVRTTLPPVDISLSRAIAEGKRTFADAGGRDGYFGAPADASVAEGRETIGVLGRILADAVLDAE